MATRAEQAADDAQRALRGAATAVRREIESMPDLMKPVKISNDFTIGDLEKPTAVMLFKEDFTPDNKITFNGKFRSRWTVKFNAMLRILGATDAPGFQLNDDLQLNGPLGGTQLQLKFKEDRLTGQLDFGHHLVHDDRDPITGKANLVTFLNPYLYLETNRSLRDQVYGFGLMTYFNRTYRDNWRLNFREVNNAVRWDLIHNMLVRHRGFVANWVMNITRSDVLFFKDRRVLLGYDRDDINVNTELKFNDGTFGSWSLFTGTASASYDFRERGLIGLFATKAFSTSDEATTLQDVGFGYRNKLRKDLEFKAKFTATGLANFFFNYQLRAGLNLHSSFQTSLVDRKRKGFLQLPFDFGLKIKLEN